jgi:hypothetical protein
MRLYRLLLHLYPASFRNEYAGEMCGVLARRLRDTSAIGLPALWIGVFFEILFNALAVHADVLRQDLRYTARALRRTWWPSASARTPPRFPWPTRFFCDPCRSPIPSNS